ncbi:MAG: right-handed parallel beta-helix repeat-containing protein, partial [Thermoplasmata archaeon]|nr:right-handed parallel beta-helix repeat-containing protein [Thermoplasmata archaeon]
NIVTQEITLNASSVMNWENVSADINGEVNIKSGATFNLTDCNLVLSGNLSIYGNLNMINSTILVNCSTMGEFFISVEKIGLQLGGSFRLTEGSIIAGPSNNLRIRVLWVDLESRLYAENSTFRYIGWVPNYKGILIEASEAIIRNSTFSHCYPGVIFSGGSRAMIENSEFSNSQVGLNFSNSINNIVRNCTFRANNIGIYGENTSQNIITEAKIIENAGHGLYLDSMSYYNNIVNGIIENNNWSGVVFENSSTNNNVSFCNIQNNNETGIICNNNSNEILITNTTLDNNEYGLKCENNSKKIKIINSTVQNSNSQDFYLAQTSELISLNTSFNRNKIQVDSDSNLTVQWYLHVQTLNSTFVPIAYVPVTLWDNENGSAEKNFTTDNSGWKRWIACTEFYKTGNVRINLTPHTLRAHKFGYSINITNISINSSQILNITMNRT